MLATKNAPFVFLTLAWLFGPCLTVAVQASSIEQTFATSLTRMPERALSVMGSIYIPAYSRVFAVPGELKVSFSVTLSVHNASHDKSLVLRRIAYFNTAGQLIENYLQQPIALKPFATIEVFIPQSDVRGGTGANFIVD